MYIDCVHTPWKRGRFWESFPNANSFKGIAEFGILIWGLLRNLLKSRFYSKLMFTFNQNNPTLYPPSLLIPQFGGWSERTYFCEPFSPHVVSGWILWSREEGEELKEETRILIDLACEDFTKCILSIDWPDWADSNSFTVLLYFSESIRPPLYPSFAISNGLIPVSMLCGCKSIKLQ